jgi:predicted porin
LSALATSVEGRYKVTAGFYAAARLDHLGFSEVSGSARRATWDAPVTRVEVGGGYAIQRNLLLKLSYQHNTRDTARVPERNLTAAQLVFWF